LRLLDLVASVRVRWLTLFSEVTVAWWSWGRSVVGALAARPVRPMTGTCLDGARAAWPTLDLGWVDRSTADLVPGIVDDRVDLASVAMLRRVA
jgi:hypothetical protein